MQQWVGTKYLMNKYLVTVRIGGKLVKTAVFADSTIHARLLCQYKYGMNSIAVSPVHVDEAEGLILVQGAVPGSEGAYLEVRDSIKRASKDLPFPASVKASAATPEPTPAAA